MVAGAIKRAGGRLAGAAGGRGLVRIEDEDRLFVGEVVGPEDAFPDILGVRKHDGDELGELLFLRGQLGGLG